MSNTLKIEEVLLKIQDTLKVTKNRTNNHGNFNFRSMEDINEKLKPILKEVNAVFIVSDEMVMLGDRFYIKATATLKTTDGQIAATGYAREANEQRGMNLSQLSGSTSSYARKYATNGLSAIDDNKDADDFMSEEEIALQDEAKKQNAIDGLRKLILTLPLDKQDEELAGVLKNANIDKIEDITHREASIQWSAINKRYKK